ncbi:heat-inducible transcription repressor HrcA [Alicyclobacillus curvatus]|nr:heat-inducible transcription repressor HrcA [Alicyclobacillus curvatus]
MLTPRQKLILSAIVENYVRSAEPVGSRTLSKNQDFHLSPATIRNEMSDLEELGFLDQPHTSAGRIPSQKGYRYYVDHLQPSLDLDSATVRALRDLFRQRMDEMERVVQQTSVVLSQLTQYTAIVLGPQVNHEKIHHIQLIPIGHNKAVAILVTDTGRVSNRQVQLSEDISSDEVARMVELLNNRLHGASMTRLKSSVYRELSTEMANTLEHYEDAIALLDEIGKVPDVDGSRVYVGGAMQMLDQPEFRDVDKVRPLLEMLERADSFGLGRVVTMNSPGIQVRIGLENNNPTLQDCTVISAAYTAAGQPVGSIGIIGPTRMNYGRVIQILDLVSQALTDTMTERLSGNSS